MGVAAILVMWPKFLHTFWLTYQMESLHEILVQLGQWFVRKLCFNILVGLQYERPKLKGQSSTLTFWNLFIAIVSLGKTYQVRIMTKASTA